MSIRILPNTGKGTVAKNLTKPVTLADNECLPKLIAGAFGWKAITIEFTNDKGQIRFFGACCKGRKIVMLPHFSYGPMADSETATALIEAIKAQGYSCEWRLTVKASEYTFTDKVTTLLPLNADADIQFNQLGSNLRRKIRKCASNGIGIKTGKSELLDDFYCIYAKNMHRLGSPALPQRWFSALLEQYCNGDVIIACAYLNNKPVGAAFMLEYNGFNEVCWFATIEKYNKLYTSYGLYWHMIQCAIENKGEQFSFGRSSMNGGVHTYKQQWGGIDIPLIWNYSHPQGKNIRKFTFLPKLWKLLPYPLARIAGPIIAGRFY